MIDALNNSQTLAFLMLFGIPFITGFAVGYMYKWLE